MGIYDLPAIIQFIREHNDGGKLFYICHSMGCSQFAVGASIYPAAEIVNEENIIATFQLAPALFQGKATFPLGLLAPYAVEYGVSIVNELLTLIYLFYTKAF